MNDFIQQNKKLLRFYCTALRLSGWFLLILGASSVAITIILSRTLSIESFGTIMINMPMPSLLLVSFGILGIGISQFIHYIQDRESKAGFVLHHRNKFIYCYIFITFAMLITRNIFTISHLQNISVGNAQILYFATSITSFALFIAKTLILIGLTQILKRLVPLIQESRTLV